MNLHHQAHFAENWSQKIIYRFLQINSHTLNNDPFPALKSIPTVFGKIEDADPFWNRRSTPPHKLKYKQRGSEKVLNIFCFK